MPFPMAHLCIADEMLRRGFDVKKPEEFLLGAVAPDSVHFREGYAYPMKEQSHLWDCGPRWGVTLDSERWFQNAMAFWQAHRMDAKRDFIAGYCAHVLTDWLNDVRIWNPFRVKNESWMDACGADRYHEEARMTDYALYLKNPRRQKIFEMLAKARGYDLAGLIFERDIERMRDSLVREQFENRTAGNPRDFCYCTLQMVEALVEEASREIPGYLA